MIGDFNAQTVETHLDNFLYQHELGNINKKPTCCKNSENPNCIYFILSHKPKFLETNAAYTGLLDFHKLVLSVFRTTFSKSKPKRMNLQEFKNFSEENFSQELRRNLREKCVKNYAPFQKFFEIL